MNAVTTTEQASSEKSVIVYGPQGCGKTRDAERMRKYFGLDRVVELDQSPTPTFGIVGDLVLTNLTHGEMLAKKLIDADARRVYDYQQVVAWMAEVEQAEATGIARAGNRLMDACHTASRNAGWWFDSKMDRDLIDLIKNPQSPIEARLAKALVAEKLCLTHSEVSEGMEGHRKNRMDDKLPHRPMLEVELADAVIRIADLAGALGMDLGGAIAEKMAFNAVRPDHKKEARESAGGKSY